MSDKLKNSIAIALIPQILLVQLLAWNPEFVESYYSKGLYPLLSRLYRFLLGWIPFSIGDILYFILSIWFLYFLYKNWGSLWSRHRLRDFIMVLSVAYFTFHLMWGVNYYRLPISESFGLEASFSKAELIDVSSQFAAASNRFQEEITGDSSSIVSVPYTKKEIFALMQTGYHSLAETYPEMNYQPRSIKASLFSTLLSYMGYGGYLNPFTQEGQVNRKLPSFRLPVVSAHEMAHQVGYSAENEANFLGYMASMKTGDPYAQYSGTTFGLSHCLAQLQAVDTTAYNQVVAKLNPGVKKNFNEAREFWISYQNPLEPLFQSAFDTFLKANRQEEGMASYNQVVALMIAYHRKNPL